MQRAQGQGKKANKHNGPAGAEQAVDVMEIVMGDIMDTAMHDQAAPMIHFIEQVMHGKENSAEMLQVSGRWRVGGRWSARERGLA